jgi:hypothetical protein
VAQDQLDNAGFEEWEDLPNAEASEPLHWSSLKDSDDPTLAGFAPVVCFRTEDAYSGQYAVELRNIQSLIVANGVVTNGRIHPDLVAAKAYTYTDPENELYHQAFTSRPDSIVGWYKYAPVGEDTIQVKVSLHKGFGKQPDPDSLQNWIGVGDFRSTRNTDDKWVRFSAPFRYMSDEAPEFALVVITSGGKMAPTAGSIAKFDDLEMIYNQNSMELIQEDPSPFISVTGSRTLWLQHMPLYHYRQLDVYDITGKRVCSALLDSDRLDLAQAGLNRGIYVIHVQGPERFYNQKIMLH